MRPASRALLLRAGALLGLALALPSAAYAQECVDAATPNDGYPAARLLTLSDDADALATFCGGDAGYTAQAWLSNTGTLIGTNHSTPSGSTVDLGAFVSGTELVFYIYVYDTGYTYYSGPGSRNPDGQVHAAIEEVEPGLFRVGFEDMYGGGDRDYDDLNFTVSVDGMVAPDPDLDSDGDGILDIDDACPRDAFPGSPDGCEVDSDGDGVGDSTDRCDGEDDTIDANGNGRADCVEAAGERLLVLDGTVSGTCYSAIDGSYTSYTGQPLTMTLSQPADAPPDGGYTYASGTNYAYGYDTYGSVLLVSVDVAGQTTTFGDAAYRYLYVQDYVYYGSASDYLSINAESSGASLSASVNTGEFVPMSRRLDQVTDGWSHSSFSFYTQDADGDCSWNGTLDTVVETVSDADGDGVPDEDDACPGFDDAVDADGDGTADGCDACPVDATGDSDGDGVCDSADPCPADLYDDSDFDGVCDSEDLCEDGDDLVDFDGDGIADDCDACPEDPANDADFDGICGNDDACDGGDDSLDADGDGTADFCDVCPFDYYNDTDFDGVCDSEDPCPLDAPDDPDGDGVCTSEDVCREGDDFANRDGDALADACDVCPDDALNDVDGDGICGDIDNCPGVGNSNQSDVDGDGLGDACEPDTDGDGIVDDTDNCRMIDNASQADTDGDGIGDACEADTDGDGVIDDHDQCAATPGEVVVDGAGCSLDQLVPCAGNWKNHGAYVSTFTQAANTFVTAGLITQAEKDALTSAAAQSSCGKKK